MDCQFLSDANLAEEPTGQQGDMAKIDNPLTAFHCTLQVTFVHFPKLHRLSWSFFLAKVMMSRWLRCP
jgi:hypothetical protein